MPPIISLPPPPINLQTSPLGYYCESAILATRLDQLKAGAEPLIAATGDQGLSVIAARELEAGALAGWAVVHAGFDDKPRFKLLRINP